MAVVSIKNIKYSFNFLSAITKAVSKQNAKILNNFPKINKNWGVVES
jgi:hypothetical protein